MQDRTTEQVPRGGWRPGLYMKPKHIGLVFCVSLVGCMVADTRPTRRSAPTLSKYSRPSGLQGKGMLKKES